MNFIIRIIVVAGTLFFLPSILSFVGVSGITVTGFSAALVASIALGLVNLLIKPIISLVTLPLNVITLGLFGLVVNGALLYLTPMLPFVTGFSIASFWPAFVGALVISLVNWLVSKL